MHSSKKVHLQTTNRVLQYLKGSPRKGILFKQSSRLVLEAYTDAYYIEFVIDRRSTIGYCIFLCGNLVIWRSNKQSLVVRSSVEAKVHTMAQGVCKLLWLKVILGDFKISCDDRMRLYCNNKSKISIADNLVQHDQTKHIEIDKHFIKEKLDSGLICTSYVSTDYQLADVFTKGLSSAKFHADVSKLGMENIYSLV